MFGGGGRVMVSGVGDGSACLGGFGRVFVRRGLGVLVPDILAFALLLGGGMESMVFGGGLFGLLSS